MRVITGIARGMKLQSFDGNDVRPTTDRVKEAIFSSIQFQIEGSTVLDLFAGTGQLGIEALSRGAKSATFIDNDKNSINIVRNNIKKTKFENSDVKIITSDAMSYLSSANEKFDFIFVDPPYRHDLIIKVLENIGNIVKPNSLIFCEHEKELELPKKIFDLELCKKYKYGKICISLYGTVLEKD